MKAGVNAATLMACMVATPCAGCSRARAFITKLEKAKKTPAFSPQPRAVTKVNVKRNLSIVSASVAYGLPFQTPLVAASRA
jgi:hypothetical protein